MIIEAKHNKVIYEFFRYYSLLKMKRNFHAFNIIGTIPQTDMPVMLISNHISWWDGFWALFFNLKILKRKFYFMMLEEQLRKYWFFRYTGGFSIKKGSKSIFQTIEYASELLSHKENILLIYPQGEIQSMHQQTINFMKGTEYIIKKCRTRIQIVFIVCFIDYFSNPKPTLNIYCDDFSDEDYSIANIQSRYNCFYKKCLELQQQNTV